MKIAKCVVCKCKSATRFASHCEKDVCSFCLLRLIRDWNSRAQDFPIGIPTWESGTLVYRSLGPTPPSE